MGVSVWSVLQELDTLNAEVSVNRNRYSYDEKSKKWSAELVVNDHDGTTLRVEGKGTTHDEALLDAWTKLDRGIHKGIRLARLAAPVETRVVGDYETLRKPGDV